MRNIALVAMREVTENLRTKGFWITVLMLPLVLALTMSIPTVLRATAARVTYTVIDPSGWLLSDLQMRIARDDWELALRSLRDTPLPSLPHGLTELLQPDAPHSEARLVALAQTLSGYTAPPDTFHPQMIVEANAWLARADQEHSAPWLRDLSASRFLYEPLGNRTERQLQLAIHAERLTAYVVFPFDPVAGEEDGRYVAASLTNRELERWLLRYVNAGVHARRIAEENLAPDVVRHIETPLRLQLIASDAAHAARAATGAAVASQWMPAVLAYLLWMTVFAATQMLLTSTIEEKSSRLAEVLLSSIDADELLAGKIIGVAITGAMIACAWLTSVIILGSLLPPAASVSANEWLAQLFSWQYLLTFALYFVLGYALFAVAIASLGALASSLRDAQNLLFPIQMVMLVPLLATIPIALNPSGSLAQVLTWIPPFTPFVMMNRAAQSPPMVVYIGTVLMLLGSIYFTWRIGSRWFRSGMLLNDARASIGDLWRLATRALPLQKSVPPK